MKSIHGRFEELEKEFLKHDRIPDTYPMREVPDLCAMLLMQKLAPLKPGEDAVCSSAHDEIFFAFDPIEVNEKASDEDVRTLVRCGIMYDRQYDCFASFV